MRPCIHTDLANDNVSAIIISTQQHIHVMHLLRPERNRGGEGVEEDAIGLGADFLCQRLVCVSHDNNEKVIVLIFVCKVN
eukprot:m.164669 g.164669  ORF g.164669 m.164669 type:complete len:80 (-) comp14407_c0_seq1:67-306(-)